MPWLTTVPVLGGYGGRRPSPCLPVAHAQEPPRPQSPSCPHRMARWWHSTHAQLRAVRQDRPHHCLTVSPAYKETRRDERQRLIGLFGSMRAGAAWYRGSEWSRPLRKVSLGWRGPIGEASIVRQQRYRVRVPFRDGRSNCGWQFRYRWTVFGTRSPLQTV